jgi:transposase InsO family protein
MTERRAWRRAVYEVTQTMTSSLPQGQVTIERLCRLARVSRAGYYRLWQASAPRQDDTAVRDAIQRVALANGRYRRGYRYITRQLRHDGLSANHKRVLRLMREDNLLGLRRRPFVPWTTDARHPWLVVPTGRAACSMSRVGNPYDNAKAERFIRTLKSEEIDGTRYRDHRDAAGHIGAFTRRRRPHHCEFPAGYSSAGCSPAEPASASPTAPMYDGRSSWHNRRRSTCPHFLSHPRGAVHMAC